MPGYHTSLLSRLPHRGGEKLFFAEPRVIQSYQRKLLFAAESLDAGHRRNEVFAAGIKGALQFDLSRQPQAAVALEFRGDHCGPEVIAVLVRAVLGLRMEMVQNAACQG